MADICIENLCKSFGDKKVIDNLNCIFESGRINCVMGKSGIGKTTLLNILMGIYEADSGTVSGISGKKISAVFQENRLCENLNAITNIKMVTDESDEKIISVLERMEIDATKKIPVSEYSGGMKRIVAIARALLAKFDILFMDEPLKGLDEETKMKVVELIKEMTKGKTVIMVTHNIEECKMFDAKLIEL